MKFGYVAETVFIKGGRLTLIKGTLPNMALYNMSLSNPKIFTERLGKIHRDLLYDGGGLLNRLHLVN